MTFSEIKETAKNLEGNYFIEKTYDLKDSHIGFIQYNKEWNLVEGIYTEEDFTNGKKENNNGIGFGNSTIYTLENFKKWAYKF